MKWVETTFGEFVDCNPMIKCKRNCLVENCEMEDIDANFKYLYPQQGKFYTGSGSKFQNGDTVFSRITPCLENGKIAQIKGLKGNVGVGSTEFFVFRGKANVSYNDFVYYLANSRYIRKSAENSMAGASGRQRADLNFIKSRTIRVPEQVEDQKRISSILSHYDDLIEINKRRIALLEESARELYKEWFVRMRFPNYENVHFVEGKPEDWDLVNLTDIIEIRYGKDHKALADGNIPCYGSGGIMRYVESQLYNGECVLIPRKGTLNNIMWVNGPFWTIDTMFYGIPMKEHVAKLVFFYLSSLNMEMFNAGAALPSMTTKILSKLSFPLPPMDIRNAFENKLGDIFSLVKTLTKYNELLSLQRDRLLPRLMSGQLEV